MNGAPRPPIGISRAARDSSAAPISCRRPWRRRRRSPAISSTFGIGTDLPEALAEPAGRPLSVVPPDDFVRTVTLSGNLGTDDERQPLFFEEAEPFVPFHKFVAAGVGRPLG